MSYKVIVSKPTYNALTETNIDRLRFSSDYNTLKYSLANGSRTLAINNNTLGYYSVSDEITHGLGYKPFFKVYASLIGLIGYSPLGFFMVIDQHNIFLSAKVDENKIYFNASGRNTGTAVIGAGDLSGKYTDFKNAWDNEPLSILNPPAAECFDLVVGWTNLLGIPHCPTPSDLSPFPYASAYQIWDDMGACQNSKFEPIINTVSNRPPKVGDIIVWDSSFPGSGGNGHTAVSNGVGNSGSFTAFSQNYPDGSNCHEESFPNYNNVSGWLRPRDQGSGSITMVPDSFNYTVTFKYKIFKNSLGL